MRDELVSIQAGWLIDGSGTGIKKNAQIICRNGVIEVIQKNRAPAAKRAKTTESIIDVSECTVLPGLIDSHVHLALLPNAHQHNRSYRPCTAADAVQQRISRHLMQNLAVGVVAVRDGGDSNAGALNYKKHQSGLAVNPVHMCAAGRACHRPGRYGHFIGRALLDNQRLADVVLQLEKAVDHIKIINSGLNSLTHFGRQTAPQFDIAEMKDAVQAARRRGFKVMVHANGTAPVEIAVAAGCDSIEHGFFMGKETMQRLADSGITWVPTVFTMKALRREMRAKGLAVDVVQRTLDHQMEQIQIAHDLGIPMALGTDAGSTGVEHGQAVIEEMRLFIDAGCRIEKAVQCASHNGAALLGLQGVGLLLKNMPATLIAVAGDPSHLPESLNQIELILIDGKQINSIY